MPQLYIISVLGVRKRRISAKTLIIDTVTTISHQVIRDNMTKKSFGLVDRNSLFPNPHATNSLRGQLASSAANLFEFPGTATTLRCPKLLRFWMDRKDLRKKTKSPFTEYDGFPANKVEVTNQTFADISDLSIEKLREGSSQIMPLDSFTFGSDSMQVRVWGERYRLSWFCDGSRAEEYPAEQLRCGQEFGGE